MEIVFITPELAPYSRSSEIGDVCAALPKALRSLGHKVSVITPLWSGIDATTHSLARRLSGVDVSVAGSVRTCILHDGRTTGGVELTFVGTGAHDDLFAHGSGGAAGNPGAALALCQAAVQLLSARDVAPDVVHVHGSFGAAALPLAKHALPAAVRVLSLHDPRALGTLPAGFELPQAVAEVAGPDSARTLLRAGVVAAQRVVARSQTEAIELLQGEHPLRAELGVEGKLTGILNGLDAARWNPLTDPLLPARFDPVELAGKARCKDGLQLALELPIQPDLPLLVCVGDASLEAGVAEQVLRAELQLVQLGKGSEALGALAARYPDRLRLVADPDERALHRAVAAADLLLVPEHDGRFGDLHLCALRYGAPPIARRRGAVADAIVDCDAALETGTGFLCEASGADLVPTIQRALSAFGKRGAFDALRRRIMRLDLSWERSARRYEHAYRP